MTKQSSQRSLPNDLIKAKRYPLFRTGFSLAEVLITLGIIGVLAAMTIPTLISNAKKQEDYSKLQKALSVISSASSQIRAENGGTMADLATTNLDFANIFIPYFKPVKTCDDQLASQTCYIPTDQSLYSLNGSVWAISTGTVQTVPKIVTADGFVYMFIISSNNCTGNQYSRNGISEFCGAVEVDINGPKAPNYFGKDIFAISINKYNTTPYRDYTKTMGFLCNKNSVNVWNGADCAHTAVSQGGIYYY